MTNFNVRENFRLIGMIFRYCNTSHEYNCFSSQFTKKTLMHEVLRKDNENMIIYRNEFIAKIDQDNVTKHLSRENIYEEIGG